MKQFKMPLFVMAIAMTCLGLFAFNSPNKNSLTPQWFKLSDSGSPTNRTDWEPDLSTDFCPSEPTEEVCRILVTNDGGVPSVASFNDILSRSDNFTEIAEGYVEYKEEN